MLSKTYERIFLTEFKIKNNQSHLFTLFMLFVIYAGNTGAHSKKSKPHINNLSKASRFYIFVAFTTILVAVWSHMQINLNAIQYAGYLFLHVFLQTIG